MLRVSHSCHYTGLLGVILKSRILLNVILLIAIMPSGILVNVILLSGTMPSVILRGIALLDVIASFLIAST